jgi:hypothetical protein
MNCYVIRLLNTSKYIVNYEVSLKRWWILCVWFKLWRREHSCKMTGLRLAQRHIMSAVYKELILIKDNQEIDYSQSADVNIWSGVVTTMLHTKASKYCVLCTQRIKVFHMDRYAVTSWNSITAFVFVTQRQRVCCQICNEFLNTSEKLSCILINCTKSHASNCWALI